MGVAGGLTTALSDRYAIESEIDSGGMVGVCRARGLKHNRSPAVRWACSSSLSGARSIILSPTKTLDRIWAADLTVCRTPSRSPS